MTAPGAARRAEHIFGELISLDPAAREAGLIELCGQDAALIAEVRSLLSFHDREGGVLESRAFPGAGELLAGLAPPHEPRIPEASRIGQYTLREVLGEGGMGVVYLAEQDRPRRTVAIKLIRRGWSTPALLRRFEHEAELLGRLHHPGIAQIYEAGVAPTETGPQPFISMELVRGANLLRFVEDRAATVRERLALVARVCDAVQHAHQRGVIHRDLKPANILVDESSGEPKVLDFGVARAAGPDPASPTLGATMGTTPGQIVGTLAYMSPEQVAGAPDEIDTRTDVYALGVILYEALCGRTPLDLRDRPVLEGARIIREEEPSRLSSVSGVFRGEIETIVQKAMAKDKLRRYQSAAELAQDIRRYLAGEPILAKQDSALYVLRTQLRRYRRLVAVGLLFAAGLIGFAIYAGAQAERERELATGESHAKREAILARDEALEATKLARAESERLRRSLYLTNIGHAQAAMLTGDIERARDLLSACPSDLRGWEWRYLSRQSDQSLGAIPLEPVARLITADRTLSRALLRGDEGNYSVVDARSGCTLGVVTMLTDWRNAIFSHDRAAIIYPMTPNYLVWHDIAADRVVRQIEGPLSPWPIATSDDGRFLLCRGSGSGLVFAFDAQTGAPLATLDVGDAVVADFSDDGSLVALGSDRGNVALYETGAWTLHWERALHDGWVRDIELSRDASIIASAGHDGSVRVWNTRDASCVTYPLHDNKVVSVALSPDARYLLSGSSDRLLKLTDLATSRTLRSMRGHANSVTRPVFDPTGDIRSLGADAVIRRWGTVLTTDQPTTTTPSPVFAGRFLPDGRSIVVGASNSTLDVYDAATLSRTRSVPIGERRFAVRTLDLTRDGSLLAAATTDGTLRLVRTSDWSVVRTLDPGERQLIAGAIAPDGSWVAAGNALGRVQVWNVSDGSPPASFRVARGSINAMAASPDSTRLALVTQDALVAIVDPRTGETSRTLEGFTGKAIGVAFSPDGSRLAACGERGQVLVWDLAAPGAPRSLRGHQDDVYTVAFSPDGTRLASAGFDNLVRLWDPARAESVLTLQGHIGVIQFAAFSPDAARLVSGDSLRMLTAWDAAARN